MSALTFAVGLILGAIAATLWWFGVWVYFGLRAEPVPEPIHVSTRIGGRRVTVMRFHPLPQDRN